MVLFKKLSRQITALFAPGVQIIRETDYGNWGDSIPVSILKDDEFSMLFLEF